MVLSLFATGSQRLQLTWGSNRLAKRSRFLPCVLCLGGVIIISYLFKLVLFLLIAFVFAVLPVVAITCDGPHMVREVELPTISEFVQSRQMDVLTFVGYSGAEYQHPEAMLEHAWRNLKEQDPEKILINIQNIENKTF